jgi:4'-phosphopantetheinyl transferase
MSMAGEQAWRAAPPAVTLGSGELHLWRVALVPTPDRAEQLEHFLAPDERARADRFHFPRDRRRYAAARGVLRSILGRYTDVPPAQVQIREGPKGKPFLMKGDGPATLQFNLAHSGNLALIAVIDRHPVGVDLEQLRDMPDADDIAGRFFSAHECAELSVIPQAQGLEAFFATWTRKEAYIKGRGEGLSLALDSFEVSVLPAAPRLLRTRCDPNEALHWTMYDVRPCPDYIGAVAVRGSPHKRAYWAWSY